MRRQTWVTSPITKDVCGFCATRLQIASSRPAALLHRRFFRSSAAARRPPAAAVVQQQDEDAPYNGGTWRSQPPKQSGGGWAPTEAPRDLTPEEQELRNALRSQPQASPVREMEVRDHEQPQSRGIGTSRSEQGLPHYRSPQQDNHLDATRRLGSQQSPTYTFRKQPSNNAQSGTVRSLPNQAFQRLNGNWNCPSCRYHNYGSNRSCRGCRITRPSFAAKASPAPAQSGGDLDRDVQFTYNFGNGRNRREERWSCPSCRFNNYPNNVYCVRCELRRPEANPREDDEVLRVKGWKHVRRRGSVPPSVPEQQQQQEEYLSEAGNSEEPYASTRVSANEQARMARMERTKDGKFVGLSQGLDASQSRFSKATRPPGYQSNLSASDVAKTGQGSPAGLAAEDGWVQWQPPLSSISQRNDELGSKESSRTSKSTEALDGWEYPVEMAGVPATDPQADNSSHPSPVGDQYRKQQLPTRSDISFDPDFQDTPQSPRPWETRRPSTGEDRSRTRGSGIEITSAPLDRNRYKERKSKKFVSAIDDLDEDEDFRIERRAERKRQREKAKFAQKVAAPPTPVFLPEFISVSNLAGVLRVRVEDFIRKMKALGFEETNNDHVLDAETAGLVASEFNFEPIIERSEDRDLLALPPAADKSILPSRPPVVTIMGHVDHGKTTLLDYLRKSAVAASEHGGITQHIGAFSVPMSGGRLVTFLDTPGHEAFLSMRQRGANVTDIVILVVAADDSVKPQTVEAINHAQAAKVPMIVAVNKIDKEDSNVERVKQDLARYGVEIEDYGGDTQVVCVSGKTGQGMDELEDAAVALADILDMRSEIDGQAEGWVLEATTKKAGRVATVLVKRGTLRPGDVIVAGTSWARVRSLRNEAGAMVPSAGPGTPVEIDGWREQPSAGDEVIQAPDEQKAKSVIEYRLEASERTKMAADMDAVNEARRLEQEKREQLEEAAELAEANPDAPATPTAPATSTSPTFQEVYFIIKADVSGSVEAVTNSVSALGNSEVRPHILRSGVGPVTEFDIDHAAVAKGHIINFNTVVEGQIQRMAEAKDVQIIDQSIIYRLVDDVKAKLGEKLPAVVTQRVLGEAEIAQVFEINTKGRATVPVAGCRVRNGVINRTAKIRVLRDKETVFDGSLSSLKNVKKDVTEMRKGNECGMSFENWTGFKVGDQVQTYEESVEKRTL